MQIVPVPLINLMRPTFVKPTVAQLLCAALSNDFKKYAFQMRLKDQSSMQNDIKKLEITDPTISSNSEKELEQQNSLSEIKQRSEVNRKSLDEFENQLKQVGKTNNEHKNSQFETKKRQSKEKARNQIQIVFQEFDQINDEDENLENQYKSDIGLSQEGNKCREKTKIIEANKENYTADEIEERPVTRNNKQKKIFKSIKLTHQFVKNKKCIRLQHKQIVKLPKISNNYILTDVSLIETIDLPKVYIDRFQLDRKRQNLLSRLFEEEQLEVKKCPYMTRERRELKRLN